jgi:hypothetical protein
MNGMNLFTRAFWILDEDVRQALKRVPEAGVKAMQQARLSAIALESDRAQLRADLMRRLRENGDERGRINDALDELDALLILERAS